MLNMTISNGTNSGVGVGDISGVLGGGIKEGSLVFIEGESDTGKSVMSQHLAYGLLSSKGYNVACYSIDYDSSGLIEQMDSMSLEARHEMATDRLRVFRINTEKALEDSDTYMKRFLNHLTKLDERFKLLVVDTASPFLSRVNTLTKIDFFHACKQLCEQKRSLILTLDTHAFNEDTLGRVYQMSDYYLKLKTPDMMLEAGRIDPRAIKIMEVTKLAGVEKHNQSGIRFEIKPKIGIQILPFMQVKI